MNNPAYSLVWMNALTIDIIKWQKEHGILNRKRTLNESLKIQ
jgi:hypothetical protein